MKLDWIKARPDEDQFGRVEKILKEGGIAIIPTDTLYGLIGRAELKKVVERIYKIKGRNESKPFIVLINSYKQLDIFGIKIGEKEAKFLEKIWPGQVSVILPCKLTKWEYLHKGTQSIAFRMIGKKNKNLFNLINKVGPLVAPSANKEEEKPAENIKQAKGYFGDQVDFYISGGTLKSEPSTLIKIKNGKVEILRQGAVKLNNLFYNSLEL